MIDQTRYGTLALSICLVVGGSQESYEKREKRGEMSPNDSMPLIRPGVRYLYINVRYDKIR
jgi:hypothetical protein